MVCEICCFSVRSCLDVCVGEGGGGGGGGGRGGEGGKKI